MLREPTRLRYGRLKLTNGAIMDDTELRDSEIALMDAIKSLMEIMLTAGIAQPKTFDKLFTNQRDGYLQKHMPAAAAIMEMLRHFAVNPDRQAYRELSRMVRNEPPQGSA